MGFGSGNPQKPGSRCWRGDGKKEDIELSSNKKRTFYSLKKENDIKALLSSGNKTQTQQLRCYYSSNNLSKTRVVVFVPKRVFKRAVDRNRAKRVIREILRQETLKLQSMDFICIIKSLTREELKYSVLSEKIKLLLHGIL